MTTVITSPKRQRPFSTLKDIYHERTNFNFIGRSRLWFMVSGLLIAVSVGALLISGLNLGVDFKGGTQWEFTVSSGNASSSQVSDALKGTPAADARILILGNDGVRVQNAELNGAGRDAVTAALAKYSKSAASSISLVSVGPTWGEQVSRKALIALLFMFILILTYLTFRFEWKMALAAIIAVVHDIIITVGIYAITGFEVTPATVVAILTILGFSLYDTVVVFDKIKENEPALGREKGDSYAAMTNRSMNQVLIRSLNTSIIALLPVISLLVVGSGILGAATLGDFSLALFVGLFIGAYSSIFVATPILVILKEREPKFRALKERAVSITGSRGFATAGAPSGQVMVMKENPVAGEVVEDEPRLEPKSSQKDPTITPRGRQARRGKRR